MTIANRLTACPKVRLIRLVLWVVVGVIIGTVLGELSWRLVPVQWKMDPNTLYTLKVDAADNMRQQGNFKGAEATLKSAIQLDPRRYEAYLDLGNLLLSKGQTNAALENYNAASLYCGRSPTNILSRDDQERERARISQKIEDIKQIAH